MKKTMRMDAIKIEVETKESGPSLLMLSGRKPGTWDMVDRKVTVKLDDYQIAALHQELWKVVRHRERQARYLRERMATEPTP